MLHLARCCFLFLGSIDPALTPSPSQQDLGRAPAPQSAHREHRVPGEARGALLPLSAAVRDAASPRTGVKDAAPPALVLTACVCYGRAGSQPVPGRQPALWVQYVQ